MLHKIKSILFNNRGFIKFCCVGVSNLSLSLIVYYVLLYIGIYYQVANICSFIVGSLNGYLWNRKWVFKVNGNNVKSLFKYYITYLATWLLSTVLLFTWVEILNISQLIAPIINVFITTPINYILSKKWTFKKI